MLAPRRGGGGARLTSSKFRPHGQFALFPAAFALLGDSGAGAPWREFTDGSERHRAQSVDAGCTFFRGLSHRPASPILMQMMSELPKVDGVAVQGGDRSLPSGMAINSTLAGRGPATATSATRACRSTARTSASPSSARCPGDRGRCNDWGPATGSATTRARATSVRAMMGHRGRTASIARSFIRLECYSLTAAPSTPGGRFRAARCSCSPTREHDHHHGGGGRVRQAGGARPHPAPAFERAALPPRPRRTLPSLAQYGAGVVRFTGSTHDERAHHEGRAKLNEHLRAKIEDNAAEIDDGGKDLQAGASTPSSATASPGSHARGGDPDPRGGCGVGAHAAEPVAGPRSRHPRRHWPRSAASWSRG